MEKKVELFDEIVLENVAMSPGGLHDRGVQWTQDGFPALPLVDDADFAFFDEHPPAPGSEEKETKGGSRAVSIMWVFGIPEYRGYLTDDQWLVLAMVSKGFMKTVSQWPVPEMKVRMLGYQLWKEFLRGCCYNFCYSATDRREHLVLPQTMEDFLMTDPYIDTCLPKHRHITHRAMLNRFQHLLKQCNYSALFRARAKLDAYPADFAPNSHLNRKSIPYIYDISNSNVTIIGQDAGHFWFSFFSDLTQKEISQRGDKYLNAYVYIRFIESNNADLLNDERAIRIAKCLKHQGHSLDAKLIERIKDNYQHVDDSMWPMFAKNAMDALAKLGRAVRRSTTKKRRREEAETKKKLKLIGIIKAKLSYFFLENKWVEIFNYVLPYYSWEDFVMVAQVSKGANKTVRQAKFFTSWERAIRDLVIHEAVSEIETPFSFQRRVIGEVKQKLERMPFYQVMSFSVFFNTLPHPEIDMDWRLNEFAYGVDPHIYDHAKFLNFRYILLLSKYSPTKLYFYLKTFYCSRMLLQYAVDESKPMLQNFMHRYCLRRTVFLQQSATNKEIFRYLKKITRLCKKFDMTVPNDPCSLDIVATVNRYLIDPQCHLPVPCDQMSDCGHTIAYSCEMVSD